MRSTTSILAVAAAALVSALAAAAPQWGEPVQSETEAVPTNPDAAVEHAVDKGDHVPELTFKNPDGETVTLASELEQGPVVLIFYRGGWCPYCVRQLKAFEKARAEIGAAGGRVVAVSTELPEFAGETKRKNKLSFPVLSDPNAVASRALGIAWTNERYRKIGKISEHQGNDRAELPLGATYVIDTDGLVRYAYLESDYKTRATPEKIIEVLNTID